MYVEWQTKTLAAFLAGLSMSKEGGREMHRAAGELEMFSRKKRSKAPTADHLTPEGQEVDQTSTSQSMNGKGPKAGSFEKISAIFGGAGTVFSFPSSKSSKE